MIQNTIEENKKLIEKYPWLMPYSVYTGEPIEDYDCTYTWLDDMPDGWRIAFGDLLCEDIQAELEKFDYVDKYRISQIKEKFGALRWYDEGVPVGCKVEDIIQDYSHISEFICIGCGELDVPCTDGWIVPVCKECVKKMNVNNPEEYWERLSKKQYPHTLPLERKYIKWSRVKGKEHIEEHITIDLTPVVKKIRYKYHERTNK